MKPTAPRMSGPKEIPNRSRPARMPSAVAPMRMSRYSEGVTFRPARARSSASVGFPCTLRLWLRESAAGRSRRSTSSRGVARGGAGVAGPGWRSRRTRSRLQKKIAIASAAGTAMMTAISWLLTQADLEKRWVGGLDGLQVDPLGRVHVRTLRIWALRRGRRVVVVGLEGVFEGRVGEKPGEEFSLALCHHHGQAAGRGGGRGAGAGGGGPDPDHVQVGEDGHRGDLAVGVDRGDDRDVVVRLDVSADALLLAGRQVDGDVAGGNGQELRLRPQRCARFGNHVGSDRL